MTFDFDRPVWSTDTDAASASASVSDPDPGNPSERGRNRVAGIVAFALAVSDVVVMGVGVAVASSDFFLLATLLAYGAIALSVAAVVLGLIAVFTRHGAWWGAGGATLGLIANPLVLVTLLSVLGG